SDAVASVLAALLPALSFAPGGAAAGGGATLGSVSTGHASPKQSGAWKYTVEFVISTWITRSHGVAGSHVRLPSRPVGVIHVALPVPTLKSRSPDGAPATVTRCSVSD